MKAVIYLIINHYNIEHNIQPTLYIGSKKDLSKFDKYWGSSKYVLEDMNNLGYKHFSKHILEKFTFTNTKEVNERESQYQKIFNVKESPWFYNKTYAVGPFYCDNTCAANTIWINDGKIEKRVNEIEFNNKWINEGFETGRMVSFNKKRIYINNGISVKAVKENELSNFLSKGWKRGRIQGNQHGRRWVHKGDHGALVKSEEVEQYINDGYSFGWKNKNKIG